MLCNFLLADLLYVTPTLNTIHFESAYQLCHVNTIGVYPMCIQFDLLWKCVESASQWVSLCERAFSVYMLYSKTEHNVQTHTCTHTHRRTHTHAHTHTHTHARAHTHRAHCTWHMQTMNDETSTYDRTDDMTISRHNYNGSCLNS